MSFALCSSSLGYLERREAKLALGVGLAWLLLCLPVFSQVNLGRIDGAITDATGSAIVGAAVTVTDVERGVSRNLATDNSGQYAAPNLTPGAYTIRAESKGFKTVERRDIVVQVGQDLRVDLTLLPGEQMESITVSGELPEVNITNAQLGGTIENETAVDLPIAGRTFLYLLNYRPGILTKPGAGGGLIQYSNGMRPDYNVYVFDGLADVNSFGTAGPLNIGFQAGGPDESVILSVDAVQEMNLVENPKAEYGWRPGAQINIGLKSGTNTLHGTAFAVGRDTAMVAQNPFFTQKAPTAFEQFGATVGGPIKRDKIFYYAGYEGQRYDVGNPKNIVVPTTASINAANPAAGAANSFPDAIADMKAHNSPINQLSLNLAGCTLAGVCTPNAGLFSNNQPNTLGWPTNFSDIGGSDNGVAKLDWHVNDKNNLNLDFFRGLGKVSAPVGNVTQPYWATDILGSVNVGRVVWSWIPSSSWVNEVRAGWDYSLQTAGASPDCKSGGGAPSYSSLGFTSGGTVCGFPNVNISGFGTPQVSPTLGDPEGIMVKSLNFAFADNVSYTHGSHLIKFGGNWAHQVFSGQTLLYVSRGVINFGPATGTSLLPGYTAAAPNTPLEDFLAGQPSSESIQVGPVQRNGTFEQFAAYIQDDWRIVPRVTLNLGLRYEFQTTLKEAHNLFGNFDPSSPSGLVQEHGADLYRAYPWDFAPRFGVAWDITGKGTTVMHAGFAISYFQPTASEFLSFGSSTNLQNMPTGWNFVAPNGTVATTPGGINTTGTIAITNPAKWAAGQSIFGSYVNATGTCGSGPTPPCKIAATATHLVSPMFFLWNFGFQHAFTNNLTLDVSYVGNHGQHLFNPIDLNQPSPVGVIPAGKTLAQAEQANRPYAVNGKFPWFSQIIYLSNYQTSNYNGLQSTLTQRVSHGLTFTLGYTYSHSLDMSPGEVQETLPQNGLNRTAEYGNGPLDVRQRFTIQTTYAIPGRKSPLQALQGWQISSAVQILSALPYSPIDPSDDLSGTGEGQDRWNLMGNAGDFSGFGQRTAIPCFGAPGSSFARVKSCTASLPAPCVAAAGALPTGPGGTTGTASLNKLGCYMVGNSVMVPPAQGTFGNMTRNMLRGTGFRVWDLTLVKSWTLKERLTTQFRAEVFNVLNSTQYAVPAANLAAPATFGASLGTPNILANSPIIGNGDMRRIQLGMRLQF